jgi:hypothetical protein
MRLAIALAMLLSGSAASVSGQSTHHASSASRVGRRPFLPRNEEITLARSAAPASVSQQATVMVFSDSGFVVAEQGTNGVVCVVNRSWPTSLEPHCFDREGAATILPMELERTMLYHRGHSVADADSVVAAGLASGRFRLPRRPAMSYMMSAGQQLVGDDGKAAGRWRPHIMIYYPMLTNRDVGLAAVPDMSVGMVTDDSEPTSSLMIVMPNFVQVGARSP